MKWNDVVSVLGQYNLASQVDGSAADDSWLHDGSVPKAAPSQEQVDALLPDAYRAFVAERGYPLLVAPSELGYGFAFLPPLAMRQVSADLGDEDMDFDEVRQARESGTYAWRHVMFAGWNFSDVDGWAFGLDEDAPEAGPQVWLVEGGLVVELVGSFEQWLGERAADIKARLDELDEDTLAEVQAREGDYEYGPEDLRGFD